MCRDGFESRTSRAQKSRPVAPAPPESLRMRIERGMVRYPHGRRGRSTACEAPMAHSTDYYRRPRTLARLCSRLATAGRAGLRTVARCASAWQEQAVGRGEIGSVPAVGRGRGSWRKAEGRRHGGQGEVRCMRDVCGATRQRRGGASHGWERAGDEGDDRATGSTGGHSDGARARTQRRRLGGLGTPVARMAVGCVLAWFGVLALAVASWAAPCTFTQVSAGYNHTCGVRSDGTVAC